MTEAQTIAFGVALAVFAIGAVVTTFFVFVYYTRTYRHLEPDIDWSTDHNLTVEPSDYDARGEEILELRKALLDAGLELQRAFERTAAAEARAADRDRLERLHASRWRSLKRARAERDEALHRLAEVETYAAQVAPVTARRAILRLVAS
jgi:hypothetical protein